MPRPFILFGAMPGLPTGTSRVATSIAAMLWLHREALDIDLLHVGWSPQALPPEGVPYATGHPWPVWAYQEGTGNFGMRAAQVGATVRWGGARNGVIFAIEDPARAFSLLPPARELQSGAGWERWGYFTIDGTNRNGVLGGPAALAVQQFQRVLAHTTYGAGVLDKIRRETSAFAESTMVIPHGIDRGIFHPAMTEAERARTQQLLNPTGTAQWVLGCVATNEPRKDIGLFVEVLAGLKAAGEAVRGWLHIDREVGEAWSVPQLTADAGIDWQSLSVTHNLTDRELACCYASCMVTLAPGRGESFGYPIVESLACGTPCVHANVAGGATHLPPEWRVSPLVMHAEGLYGVERPILGPGLVQATIESVVETVRRDWKGVRQECLQRAEAYDQQDVDTAMRAWVETNLERR